ncbi:MAG: RNA-guided endonuclease InsQ/TnpB family protein, partial [Methanotrichaceae archaeon]
MLKVLRYRIYPTKSQRTKMVDTLELCRWTYNETLAIRKNTYEQEGKSISYYETKKLLPQWKKEKPELKGIHSQVLQEVVKRVELAYQAFFRRIKEGKDIGYPRFKGYGRYDSFTYTQTGFSLKPGKLWLSKIGDIKIKLHRAILGEIQRLNIRRMPTGKWFVSFIVDVVPDEPLPKTGLSTGIDVGLKSFITLSNGEYINNPRFFVHEEKALAKAQRKLSRAEKGTPEKARALKAVHRVYERITNKRDDFVQKLSLKLVKSYDLIAFEELNIKGMVKNHCLAKHIADAAWNKLIITTSYKVFQPAGWNFSDYRRKA